MSRPPTFPPPQPQQRSHSPLPPTSQVTHTQTPFQELIADLTRDAQRAQPKDALQFCANWFNSRLSEQRTRLIDLVLNSRGIPASTSTGNLGMASNSSSRRTSSPSPFGTLNIPGNQAFSSPSTHRTPLPFPNGDNFLGPPASALGRRISVSAESIEPSSGPEVPPPFFFKTHEQIKRLEDSISNAFLFRNLDEKKRKAVLGAMKEMKFDKNVRVITQGDAGDYFYVVDSGELDCFVKKADDGHPAYPGAPPPPPPGPPQPGDHPEYGKKVFQYTKGTSFGELALMYSTPRAATIISTTPVTLWALDRVTFKTILLEIASRTRKDYESFLRSVPILHSLTDRERAKLADVLQSREVAYGEVVVEQGEVGREFYIVEEGEATVSKKIDGKDEEEIVMHLKRGDYFGELALLHRAPRAATVRAGNTESAAWSGDTPKLKLAALDADAFTRLLGPLRELLERTAEVKYTTPQQPDA